MSSLAINSILAVSCSRLLAKSYIIVLFFFVGIGSCIGPAHYLSLSWDKTFKYLPYMPRIDFKIGGGELS